MLTRIEVTIGKKNTKFPLFINKSPGNLGSPVMLKNSNTTPPVITNNNPIIIRICAISVINYMLLALHH